MSRKDKVLKYTPYVPDATTPLEEDHVCVVRQLQKIVVLTCVAAVALETTIRDITAPSTTKEMKTTGGGGHGMRWPR